MTLTFRPEDPFPLAPSGTPYEAEKAHAALVDAWLGLATEETEKAVLDPRDGAQRWLHVPAATFLTPYTELRRMLELVAPPPGALLVDLGAGYGRLGFVVEAHSGARFLGLELVPERVAAGARALRAFGAGRAELLQADLAAPEFSPPPADWYFIYDYGTREAIGKTLADLRGLARERPVRVAGRGRAVRDAIEREHPWLGAVVEPRHHGNFTLYASSEG
jgi:hypothetical protein